MAGARTTLSLQDKLTGPLMKMMKAMDRTISIMEKMDQAANKIDTKGLRRARSEIQSATADLERLRSSTRATDQLSGGFNRIRSPVVRATSAVRDFFASFAGAAGAYLSLQGLANGFKKFVGASDAYVSTSARLKLINDGLQTQEKLQDNIYNAAQRSLTLYNDMANSVAKLNLLAGHAFSGNNETIRFSELMGKAFAVSGASTGEQQAGMHQLTQAMASGRLQGDEYVSIIENAPLLANAIEKAMGQGQGSLKQLSSDGKITASVIKNALFGAGAEIEEMFSSLPLTFADAMVLMRNWAGRAFEPLFIRFNQFVNSDAFKVLAGHVMWFVNIFIAGMSIMFDALEWVYGIISSIGQFFQSNWGWIAPIITVIVSALAALVTILAISTTWWLAVAAAKWIASTAMWAVNSAVLAFPGTWILIAFVAVIALVIYAMVAWAEQTAAVVGAIVGAFYWLGAAFYNILMGIGNLIIIVVEFFVNTWNLGTYAVQMGFIGFNTTVWLVLDAIANAALVVAEFFVNTWNMALYLAQLGWIAFNIGARMVLDAIGNAALAVAEWFANTWNSAVYGVQMAFYKMGTFVGTTMSGVASGVVGVVNSALGAVSTLINSAVGGINALIGMINNIPGVNISTVGTVDLKLGAGVTNFAANIGKNLVAPTKAANVSLGRMNTAGNYANSVTMPNAPGKANLGTVNNAAKYVNNVKEPSAPVKKSYDRLEYTSLGDAYAEGNAAGQNLSLKASDKLTGVLDKVSGLINKGGKDNPFAGDIPNGDLSPGAGSGDPLGGGKDKLGGGKGGKGSNPTGGKLDSVGKIDDEISIADEDLKMLKELADIRSIQNFRTLQPSFTFGDLTIREEADIKKIIKDIEEYMQSEMDRSTEGVYT